MAITTTKPFLRRIPEEPFTPLSDTDLEQAVEAAMETIDDVTPEPPREEAPASHRDLISRSKMAFTNQIEQLQKRIDAVNGGIIDSAKKRDEEITKLEAQHRAFMADAELDLYQIKTLKAAVELANASLEHAE